MMGWLYKMGGFVKNWKHRWFVAREGKLTYFHGTNDPTPLGSVDLQGVTVDVCEPNEINARNQCLHYFKVVPPRAGMRTYYFGADKESDMIAWIGVLGAQSCYGITLDSERHSNQLRGPVPRSLVRSHTFTSTRERPHSSGSDSFSNSSGAPPPSVLFSGPATRSSERASLPSNPIHAGSGRPPASGSNGLRGSDIAPRASVEEEFDERYLSSQNEPTYHPSVPVDMSSTMSAAEQATLLQEVDSFQGGYIYSADELEEAAQLQQYMRATEMPPSDEHGGSATPMTLAGAVQRLIAQQQRNGAEQLLTEVVLTRFPRLVDAMDYDPLAFTQMIAGNDISSGNRQSASHVRPSSAGRATYF